MTYEEAKKAFFSSVSGRTRSKRDAYVGINAQVQGINISSSDGIREPKRMRQLPPPSVGGQRKRPAVSCKKVSFPSKRPSASVEIFPEDVSHQRFCVQEGIEVIDKAEFISQKSFSTSKIRSSSKERLKGSSSSATPKKDAGNASKNVASDDYGDSLSPHHGSDHAWSHKPSLFIQIGSESDSDDMMPEDIEIQRLDEAEIEGLSAARLSKNVVGVSARTNIVSAHHSMIFTPRDNFTDSDTLADDSTTLADKDNNNENRSFREITSKRNSEGVLQKRISPYLQADRSGSSAHKVNKDEIKDHKQPEIEIINESEFRKWKGQFVKKIGSSTSKEQDKEHIAATSAKNVIRVSKKKASFIKNDRNRKKRKVSDSSLKRKGEAWNHNVDDDDDDWDRSSDESLCSSSSTESDSDDDSSYDPEQEMGVSIANQTRRKMGRIKNASEVGSVSLGSSTDLDSSPTDSESNSCLNADFEVGSPDSDIELLSPSLEACKVQEENEETDGPFHYEADAEEGLKETCSKQSNSENDQSQAWTRGPKEVAPPTDSKYGSDHSVDDDDDDDEDYDDDKEKTEATSSDFLVRATTTTTDMAREMKVPSGPKEAALLSHSKDGCDHSHDGSKKRTEVTSSYSHVHAKKKTPDMAKEKKVPAKAKEAAPSSQSNEGHHHSNDGTNERTKATMASDSHLRAKDNPAGMASEKKVPARPKKAAPPSHSKDACNHIGDGTVESTEVKGSHSYIRAKKKSADMANGKRVPTRAEAAHSSHSNDGHDSTKERTEAVTMSDSHLHTNNKPEVMDSEKKVPTGSKKAASPSHSEDVYAHTHKDVPKERTEAATSCSYHHARTEAADMANETEVPRRRNKLSLKGVKDLCSMLADAVLGSGQLPISKEICEEAKQAPAPQTPCTLPLKFRFEDEVPELVEKTEYEKEVDNLFSELDCSWELDKVQSFDYPKDNLENGNSPPEETQHAKCSRGIHELVLEDDAGLVCIYCRHEELGPKDVMPEWAERLYRDSARKKSHETEQHLEFDELHLTTNGVDAAGSSSNATGTVWNIKPGVRESMYEHQREGFEFLWKNLAGSIDLDELKSTKPVGVGGCIISHAPGTGKTRLTMVFIETFFKLFPDCRPVIISPASTLLNWEEEFKKWDVEFPFHNLSNTELSGKENKAVVGLFPQTKSKDSESTRMIKILTWSMGGGILGISYSLFEKLTGDGEGKIKEKRTMRKILLEKPGLVVLDEGHTPRNSRSSIWNALLKLKTERRIILSGTPFQNNFSELFNTLRIVRPAIADVLAEEKMFTEAAAQKRKNKNKWEQQSSLISERALEHLKGCMSPFVNLHTGTILKQSLPGLRDCVILLKPSALQKSVIETIDGSSNFKYEHEVAMLSVHPYLLLKCETTESRKIGVDMAAVEASKLNPQEGVKTKFLVELVRLSMAVKEKVLVFSQYIQPLELIKEQLREVFKWADEKEILHMRGKQSQKQRQFLINLFNNPQNESKIMLASTRCCAEGISLIGASRVVLLDVVWNPSVERQAICRAYRIGQKKFVHTYHLMTSGTTEDDKYCRQAEKERLSELVFSSSNESNQQKQTSSGIEDRILEVMIAHDGLKGMFEKIINQPKETNLIETFGLTD